MNERLLLISGLVILGLTGALSASIGYVLLAGALTAYLYNNHS